MGRKPGALFLISFLNQTTRWSKPWLKDAAKARKQIVLGLFAFPAWAKGTAVK
jgi:hypothetical protein